MKIIKHYLKTVLFFWTIFFIFTFFPGCVCKQSTESKAFISGNSGVYANFSADTYLPWEGGPAYYSKWINGPCADVNYFPITVWLQSSSSTNAYKAIGVNAQVGLWLGPTSQQLADFTARDLPVFCEQNSTGLTDTNNGIIRAWTHMDEPDNAQSDGNGGYGPPVTPSVIVERYNTMKANDSTRPVFLNLGQGVAWDGWWGRGTRTSHPEDYSQYAIGADILCYDIYPKNTNAAAVKDKIWLVAYGVDRLRGWSNFSKPVWAAVESTHYGTEGSGPSAGDVKAEVWMAIIHGARGIVYFCHVFSPSFIEAGLLADSGMSSAVSAVNAQITSHAAVLNTQSVANGVTVSINDASVPVDTMLKRHGGYTYLFAVSMRPGTVSAEFTLRDFPAAATAEVEGEDRTIQVVDGVMKDIFTDFAVHIYKIK